MRHTYSSKVKLVRGQTERVDGMQTFTYAEVDRLDCRIDLLFRRPGRDELGYAVEAGRAPDRMGVMFCDPREILAGDRIVTVSGPVSGTFEINTVPDEALDLTTVHHLELTVREVSQTLVRS